MFETKTCSRCGGTGKFSYNLMHGDMCYGCRGTGIQYTKRGKIARTFYEDSLKIPASELKVGMGIKEDSGYKNFSLIEIIDFGTDKELGEKYNTCYYVGPMGDKQMIYVQTQRTKAKFTPETLVRVMHTDEEKRIKLEAAKAFQDSLNANGTVSKRKSKSKS